MTGTQPGDALKPAVEAARERTDAAFAALENAQGKDEVITASGALSEALTAQYLLVRSNGWKGFQAFAEAERLVESVPEAADAFRQAKAACRDQMIWSMGNRLGSTQFGQCGSMKHLTWAAERHAVLREIVAGEFESLGLEQNARELRAQAGSSGLMQKLKDRIAESKHGEREAKAIGRCNAVRNLSQHTDRMDVLRYVMDRSMSEGGNDFEEAQSFSAALETFRMAGGTEREVAPYAAAAAGNWTTARHMSA